MDVKPLSVDAIKNIKLFSKGDWRVAMKRIHDRDYPSSPHETWKQCIDLISMSEPSISASVLKSNGLNVKLTKKQSKLYQKNRNSITFSNEKAKTIIRNADSFWLQSRIERLAKEMVSWSMDNFAEELADGPCYQCSKCKLVFLSNGLWRGGHDVTGQCHTCDVVYCYKCYDEYDFHELFAECFEEDCSDCARGYCLDDYYERRCENCSDDKFLNLIDEQDKERERIEWIRMTQGRRRQELTSILKEYGLDLMPNKRCDRYIQADEGDVYEIAERMCELKFIGEYIEEGDFGMDEHDIQWITYVGLHRYDDEDIEEDYHIIYPERWPWLYYSSQGEHFNADRWRDRQEWLRRELAEHLHNPARVQKWLEAGNELENYLA